MSQISYKIWQVLVLLENCILRWKGLPGTNAPAYLASSSVTKKKGLMESTPGWKTGSTSSSLPTCRSRRARTTWMNWCQFCKTFSSSPTAAQNKLLCFSLASFFSNQSNIWSRLVHHKVFRYTLLTNIRQPWKSGEGSNALAYLQHCPWRRKTYFNFCCRSTCCNDMNPSARGSSRPGFNVIKHFSLPLMLQRK